MINEFYASLVNRPPGLQTIGDDYIPDEWQSVELHPIVSAIRNILLVRTTSREAVNWRALEIRRLLPKTDLATLFYRFDHRDGYEITALVNEMAVKFKPEVTGSEDIKVTFSGQLFADAYQLFTWDIDVNEFTWQITANMGQVITGDVADNPIITANLPGAYDVRVMFTAVPGQKRIVWGAKPRIHIADTARNLQTTVASNVASLADLPNRFDRAERYLLRDIILQRHEPGAQVCAAALLLSGHVLNVGVTA